MRHSSVPQNSTTVRSRNAVRFARAALQTAYILSEGLGTSFAERLFTSPRRYSRPDRERAVFATARPSVVEVTLRSPRAHGAKVEVATWRWGLGPAVLLVHGWEGRGSQLGAFVEPLVAAGLSVVAFDAPAHGNSPGHRLYLTDLADAIADVAESSGPLHGIIAHSFGAAGVLLAASRNGLRAPRNAMLAPNVLIDDAVRRFARLVGLDETDRIALEERLERASGFAVDALHLPNLVGDRRTDELLVVHDRADREVPFAHGEALAAIWPNATLREARELGHRRILRDPDIIAAVVDLMSDGIPLPASDLVREVDRQLEALS